MYIFYHQHTSLVDTWLEHERNYVIGIAYKFSASLQLKNGVIVNQRARNVTSSRFWYSFVNARARHERVNLAVAPHAALAPSL